MKEDCLRQQQLGLLGDVRTVNLVGFEPRSTKSIHLIWAKKQNEQKKHTERI